MTYISINRVAVKPGSAAEFERIAAAWLRSERKRLPLEELIDRQLVRADSGAEYAMITLWATRAAHERSEDSPAEREGLQQIAGYLAGPPEQFGGEVIGESSRAGHST
jgi:heme-degrading monooxygenase HmoA